MQNISAATSYSEMGEAERISQQQQQQQQLGQQQLGLSNFFNKNELISRSSKITQELEARLKERRQIIENKSCGQQAFKPRVYQHMDIIGMARDTETWRDKLDLGISMPK